MIRANPLVCEIRPNCELPKSLVGVSNLGVLVALRNSTLNEARVDSVTPTVFVSDTSRLAQPGPRQSPILRGALPTVNGSACVKAPLLNQFVSRSCGLPAVHGLTPATRLGLCWPP